MRDPYWLDLHVTKIAVDEAYMGAYTESVGGTHTGSAQCVLKLGDESMSTSLPIMPVAVANIAADLTSSLAVKSDSYVLFDLNDEKREKENRNEDEKEKEEEKEGRIYSNMRIPTSRDVLREYALSVSVFTNSASIKAQTEKDVAGVVEGDVEGIKRRVGEKDILGRSRLLCEGKVTVEDMATDRSADGDTSVYHSPSPYTCCIQVHYTHDTHYTHYTHSPPYTTPPSPSYTHYRKPCLSVRTSDLK